MTQSVIVSLSISPDEYVKAYRGPGKSVQAVDAQGRSVRFPANILRPFVEHDGVHGRFRIDFTDHGKFSKISRIG